MEHRTGIGYDLHRTTADRPLILGGVRIACDFGLLGHSDADVVLHAIVDALLGAISAGDIGDLFPDDDPRYAGADSRLFIEEARRRVSGAGWEIGNVDTVIHAQRPKLAEHKAAIRASVAALLQISLAQVGVKATTNERLDAIGRGEAIACFATALLQRPAS